MWPICKGAQSLLRSGASETTMSVMLAIARFEQSNILSCRRLEGVESSHGLVTQQF